MGKARKKNRVSKKSARSIDKSNFYRRKSLSLIPRNIKRTPMKRRRNMVNRFAVFGENNDANPKTPVKIKKICFSNIPTSATTHDSNDSDCELIVVQNMESVIVLDDDDDDSRSAPIGKENITEREDTQDTSVAHNDYPKTGDSDATNSSAVNQSVIVINDSLDESSIGKDEFYVDVKPAPCTSKPIYERMNDSVIFVGEFKDPLKPIKRTPDFIPIMGDSKPMPKKIGSTNNKYEMKGTSSNALSPKRRLKKFERFERNAQTSTDRQRNHKQNHLSRATTSTATSSNNQLSPIRQPTNFVTCIKNADAQRRKRMIIVDGSNVAYQHSKSEFFSVEGLETCINSMIAEGFHVQAVVPLFRVNPHMSSDPAKLQALHKENKVVFSPCKNLPQQKSMSYDDRFIIRLAERLDAAIVSNDNYKDLLSENEQWRKIITTRVITYMWFQDMFMLSTDPYGQFGPTLEQIVFY